MPDPSAAMLAIVTAKTDLPLSAAPIVPGWIIEGNPVAHAAQVARSSDGLARTVVWECTEGKFHWHYDIDETILVLEGSVVIESDDMAPTRFGAGDVILFRKGAHARWHVERKIRKLAFCQQVQPRVIGLGLRVMNRLGRMIRPSPAGLSPLGA